MGSLSRQIRRNAWSKQTGVPKYVPGRPGIPARRNLYGWFKRWAVVGGMIQAGLAAVSEPRRSP